MRMACGHAYSLEKLPRVRPDFGFALRLLMFHRRWVCWARLPCLALATFASDVRKQNPGYSLPDFPLVIHRTSLG